MSRSKLLSHPREEGAQEEMVSLGPWESWSLEEWPPGQARRWKFHCRSAWPLSPLLLTSQQPTPQAEGSWRAPHRQQRRAESGASGLLGSEEGTSPHGELAMPSAERSFTSPLTISVGQRCFGACVQSAMYRAGT